MSNMNGIGAYTRTEENWKTRNDKINTKKTESAQTSAEKADASTGKVKYSEWKPIDTKSALVPKTKDGYGTVIGDVKLSEKAQKYYETLKAKFYNSDFILVSKDMKSAVQANAAAYGNANKMVVLIDEEKLERMATDESFRKKYEGIIAMGEKQMAQAKGTLTSQGAAVKNFGINVNADGTTDFFATLEKSSKAQAERIEKKRAEKREEKIKEAKKEKAKAKKEKLEAKDAENAENADRIKEPEKEYVTIKASSMEELISKVSNYAFEASSNNVFTEAERSLGTAIDFKG